MNLKIILYEIASKLFTYNSYEYIHFWKQMTDVKLLLCKEVPVV